MPSVYLARRSSNVMICSVTKTLKGRQLSLIKELCLQNSMRATVELHEQSKEELPPVKTRVTLGKEDLSIKVNGHRQPASFLKYYVV